MTAKISISIALHGDGWWTATVHADGYEPVKCVTDASDELDAAMITWMDDLAGGQRNDLRFGQLRNLRRRQCGNLVGFQRRHLRGGQEGQLGRRQRRDLAGLQAGDLAG